MQKRKTIYIANPLSYSDNTNIKLEFKSIISEMSNKDNIDAIYNVPAFFYDSCLNDFKDKVVIVSNCNEGTDSRMKNAKVIVVESLNDISSAKSSSKNIST